MLGNNKGQYFIIAALLLCMLFYTLKTMMGTEIITTGEDVIARESFDNIKEAYGEAIDLVLLYSNNSQAIRGNMGALSVFLKSHAREHGNELKVIYLVTMPLGDKVNVSIGNFLGENTSVVVSILGDELDYGLIENGFSETLASNASESYALYFNYTFNGETYQENMNCSERSHAIIDLELTAPSAVYRGIVKA